MKKIYLIDFDGTITKDDTLVYLSKIFYPEKSKMWYKKLMNGEYSIKEWIEEFERTFDITEEEYKKALKNIEIDNYFKEFIIGKEVCILSGGFDYNIKLILSRYNIENIKVYANEMKFVEKNKIKIDMVHFDKRYDYSAVAKEVIIENYKKEYEEVIFIGDGITDFGASKLADKVYAKRGSHLVEYLMKEKISFKEFDNFKEID